MVLELAKKWLVSLVVVACVEVFWRCLSQEKMVGWRNRLDSVVGVVVGGRREARSIRKSCEE